MDHPNSTGSLLASLYIRLRDEVGLGDCNLDPNDKLRAPIALAILSAAETLGSDIARIESLVRQTIGKSKFQVDPRPRTGK